MPYYAFFALFLFVWCCLWLPGSAGSCSLCSSMTRWFFTAITERTGALQQQQLGWRWKRTSNGTRLHLVCKCWCLFFLMFFSYIWRFLSQAFTHWWHCVRNVASSYFGKRTWRTTWRWMWAALSGLPAMLLQQTKVFFLKLTNTHVLKTQAWHLSIFLLMFSACRLEVPSGHAVLEPGCAEEWSSVVFVFIAFVWVLNMAVKPRTWTKRFASLRVKNKSMIIINRISPVYNWYWPAFHFNFFVAFRSIWERRPR